ELAGRLKARKNELASLEAQAALPLAEVAHMVPRLAERYRALVDELANVPAAEVAHARAALRPLFGGEIRLRPSASGEFLEASVPSLDHLLQLAVSNGLNFKEHTIGVAGEGFEPSTF